MSDCVPAASVRVRDRGRAGDSRTERVKERKKERASESNSKQSNDRWTPDVTQLSVAGQHFHDWRAARATKTNDPAMKENEDFITHFPLTPLLAHAPQIAYMCVCVCACFCTGKLTKCVSCFSWQAGLWSYAGPRVQFREITHSVGDLWRNAQGLERLYVTCVSVYGKGVCLKRTFISSSDIITLPQGRRGVIQLSLLHPSPSPPSSSSLTFAFLSELRKPSSEVIMGLTYSQSMDLCLGVHEGGGWGGSAVLCSPTHGSL